MRIPRAPKLHLVSSLFTSRKAGRRTVAWILLLVATLIAGSLLLSQYVPWILDPVAIQERVAAAGPFAPVVFVLLQAAQVVVAPIPGQAMAFISGYLFGLLAGTVYSLIGATIGSYIVFRLSRRYGREHIERAIDPDLVHRFDDMVARRGLLALFVVFLIPGLPDDIICFLAGLTTLRIRHMLIVSMAGRFPGYVIANAAGAQLEAGNLLTSSLILLGAAVFVVLGYVWRDRVLRWLSEPPQ